MSKEEQQSPRFQINDRVVPIRGGHAYSGWEGIVREVQEYTSLDASTRFRYTVTFGMTPLLYEFTERELVPADRRGSARPDSPLNREEGALLLRQIAQRLAQYTATPMGDVVSLLQGVALLIEADDHHNLRLVAQHISALRALPTT